MNRHFPVVLAAALLSLLVLPACSSQPVPTSVEVSLPGLSPSPLLLPRPAAGPGANQKSSKAPKTSEPARPAAPPRVPITGTDPARTLPSRANEPVRLEVDGVDVAMPVIPVGVADGVMALPESVAEAGWYEFGSRPGDGAGTAVLAAHVDSKEEGLGPFARLRGVRSGAEITVTARNGKVHRYVVSSVKKIPKREVPLAEVFDRGGAPRLTLLTCGGAYDRDTGYTDNVVVTARPASAVS